MRQRLLLHITHVLFCLLSVSHTCSFNLSVTPTSEVCVASASSWLWQLIFLVYGNFTLSSCFMELHLRNSWKSLLLFKAYSFRRDLRLLLLECSQMNRTFPLTVSTRVKTMRGNLLQGDMFPPTFHGSSRSSEVLTLQEPLIETLSLPRPCLLLHHVGPWAHRFWPMGHQQTPSGKCRSWVGSPWRSGSATQSRRLFVGHSKDIARTAMSTCCAVTDCSSRHPQNHTTAKVAPCSLVALHSRAFASVPQLHLFSAGDGFLWTLIQK